MCPCVCVPCVFLCVSVSVCMCVCLVRVKIPSLPPLAGIEVSLQQDPKIRWQTPAPLSLYSQKMYNGRVTFSSQQPGFFRVAVVLYFVTKGTLCVSCVIVRVPYCVSCVVCVLCVPCMSVFVCVCVMLAYFGSHPRIDNVEFSIWRFLEFEVYDPAIHEVIKAKEPYKRWQPPAKSHAPRTVYVECVCVCFVCGVCGVFVSAVYVVLSLCVWMCVCVCSLKCLP